MNTTTRLAVLFAAAIAGQALVATAAHAVPGRTVVFANSASDSTPRKTARAFCPSGTVVVGGGAALQASGRESITFRTVTPFRSVVDGRYGYTVIAEESTPFTGSWSMAVRAICAPAPAGYEIKSVTLDSSTTTPKSVSARCSAGKKALAPGGTVRGPNFLSPQLTLRGVLVNAARDGAFAIGDATSGEWDMIATVVCATQPAGYTVIERDVTATQADSVAQAVCPAGKVHGSGGLFIPSVAGDVHVYTMGSIEPDTTVIRAYGTRGTWSVRAQSVCAA